MEINLLYKHLSKYYYGNILILRNKYVKVDNYLKFYIDFEKRYLYIITLNSTNMYNGTYIIHQLEEYIKDYSLNDYIDNIKLLDDSMIIYFDSLGNDFTCRFSILNILSDRKSWYNKLGYYQLNYNESLHDKILKLNFHSIVKEFIENIYSFEELFNLNIIYKILNKIKSKTQTELVSFFINFILKNLPDENLTCNDVGIYLKQNKRNSDDNFIYLSIAILDLIDYLFNYEKEIKLYKCIKKNI